MQDGFDRALKLTLRFEGGNDDDPRDPGGRTSRGIIQREYNAYRKRKGQAPADVWKATDAEVHDIYRVQYWDRIRGDELPPGVDAVVYDGAVNSGPGQAVKWLQRALGVGADGVLGEMTLAACQNHPDHDRLIADILQRRLAFLRALKTYKHFGRGWTSRVQQLLRQTQAWAMGSVGPAIVYVPGMEKKANVWDANKAPSTIAPQVATGGGIGVAGVVNETKDQLLSFTAIPFVEKVVLGLTVVGLTVTVGGLAWSWWAHRRSTERLDVLDLAPDLQAEAVP